eukprot:5257845-Prymnesium_polylepis.2
MSPYIVARWRSVAICRICVMTDMMAKELEPVATSCTQQGGTVAPARLCRRRRGGMVAVRATTACGRRRPANAPPAPHLAFDAGVCEIHKVCRAVELVPFVQSRSRAVHAGDDERVEANGHVHLPQRRVKHRVGPRESLDAARRARGGQGGENHQDPRDE